MTGGADPIPPPSAAIVSVGDELLLGETVDASGSWLAQELSHLGFRVLRRWVVGDAPGGIRQAVQSAFGVAEVVLVTGGLGTTPDDLTRGAAAGLVFPDPNGAAPGLAMETQEGGLCILLPGVPKEMKRIFEEATEPLLRKRYATRLRSAVHRVIHTFGVPESVLSSEIEAVLPPDTDDVSLAYLPDLLGVRLRLTAREAASTGDAEASLQRVEDLLKPVLSRYRYEAKSGDLAEAVGTALLGTGDTLAVAESCTGGLISKRLTDFPGSSRYFLGGVVAYANQVKAGVFGVEEELIRHDGVVGVAVAEAMAVGVARELKASVGIGVTGIAGPGGGSAEKPVGTVCYAVSLGGETVARRELFPGDREAVRERAAQATLGLLLGLLEGRDG